MTKVVAGHNDPGYLPDEDPVECENLQEAIHYLMQAVATYFRIEVDEIELTVQDVMRFQRAVINAKPGSMYIFRGHAFWVH